MKTSRSSAPPPPRSAGCRLESGNGRLVNWDCVWEAAAADHSLRSSSAAMNVLCSLQSVRWIDCQAAYYGPFGALLLLCPTPLLSHWILNRWWKHYRARAWPRLPSIHQPVIDGIFESKLIEFRNKTHMSQVGIGSDSKDITTIHYQPSLAYPDIAFVDKLYELHLISPGLTIPSIEANITWGFKYKYACLLYIFSVYPNPFSSNDFW